MLKTVLVTLESIPTVAEVKGLADTTRLDSQKSDQSLSRQVLSALDHLAWGPDSQIILSHIIPSDRTSVDVKSDRPRVDCQGLAEDWESQLEELQEQLPCSSKLEITQGDPAEEIIRLANIHHADLIVMGCRGLVGIDRIVSRSVSAQVAEESPCSVWVVKPH